MLVTHIHSHMLKVTSGYMVGGPGTTIEIDESMFGGCTKWAQGPMSKFRFSSDYWKNWPLLQVFLLL